VDQSFRRELAFLAYSLRWITTENDIEHPLASEHNGGGRALLIDQLVDYRWRLSEYFFEQPRCQLTRIHIFAFGNQLAAMPKRRTRPALNRSQGGGDLTFNSLTGVLQPALHITGRPWIEPFVVHFLHDGLPNRVFRE
jgi:hypothetical protein